MTAKQTFTTVLEKHPTLNATSITIPFDVEAAFGSKKVPVLAAVNGALYRGTVLKMGGKYLLGIPKAFREAAKINTGEYIVVTIERDEEPRVVVTPDDLTEALKTNQAASNAWDKLNYTHKKEHVRAIEEAKRPETRSRRIAKAIAMLTAKK